MNNLHRLIYTSFKNDSCSDLEVIKILQASYRNNFYKEITGILIHSDIRFIQYIEGTKENLKELFEVLKKDSRHTTVSLLNFEAIDKRIFSNWNMGYLEISNEDIEYNNSVTDKDKSSFIQLMKGELEFENNGIRLLQLFFKKFSQPQLLDPYKPFLGTRAS